MNVELIILAIIIVGFLAMLVFGIILSFAYWKKSKKCENVTVSETSGVVNPDFESPTGVDDRIGDYRFFCSELKRCPQCQAAIPAGALRACVHNVCCKRG